MVLRTYFIMLIQKTESKLSIFSLIIMKRQCRHHLIGKNIKKHLTLTNDAHGSLAKTEKTFYVLHITSNIFRTHPLGTLPPLSRKRQPPSNPPKGGRKIVPPKSKITSPSPLGEAGRGLSITAFLTRRLWRLGLATRRWSRATGIGQAWCWPTTCATSQTMTLRSSKLSCVPHPSWMR